MIGSNLTEATFFNATPTAPLDDAALKEAASKVPFTAGMSPEALDKALTSYREFYPDLEDYQRFQILATDIWMTGTVQTAATARADAGAPTWVYHFEMPQGAREGALNVPHTSEIAYAFDNLELSKTLVGEPDAEDQALADVMSTAWTNFAKTGNPNGEGCAGLAAVDLRQPRRDGVRCRSDGCR